MGAWIPYAGDEQSHVGFSIKGHQYTPERPCSFDSYCTPNDYENWKRHAMEWLVKLKPIDADAHRRLLERYSELIARNDGCRVSCSSAVHALVSTAQLARASAEAAGTPVTDVENDWGIGPIEPLPIPSDILSELKDLFDKAKKKATDHVMGRWSVYLAIGGLILWAYLARGRR